MRIWVSVNDQTKEFDLARRPVIIGRAETCDFQPTGAGTEFVSGKHAILKLHEGTLTLEDLGSSNGTYVNDLLCTAVTRLNPSDRIRLGRLGPALSLSAAPVLGKLAPAPDTTPEKNIASVERRSFFGNSPLEATEKAPPIRNERQDSSEKSPPYADPHRSAPGPERQPDNIFASKNKPSPFGHSPEPALKDHAAHERESQGRESKNRGPHGQHGKQEPSTRALLIKAQRQNHITSMLTIVLVMAACVGVGAFVFIQSRRNADDRVQRPSNRENLLDERMAAFQLQCSLSTALVKVVGSEEQLASGSGFLVDRERGLVMTCASLLANHRSIDVYFPICHDDGTLLNEMSLYLDQAQGWPAKVVGIDIEKDLALLEVSLDQSTNSPLQSSLAQQAPEPGSDIFACGISDSEQIQGWLVEEGTVVAVMNDFMCQIDDSHELNVDVIISSHALSPGTQGGPVFNEKGEVVAMISHSTPDARLQSQFIAISEIREFYETRVD